MRRTINRIMAIMAVAAMAFATGGCVEPLDNNVRGIDPDAVYLPIRLYIPGVIPATKVTIGDVKSVGDESQIHSVQVWMFNHLNPASDPTDQDKAATAVAYAEVGSLSGQSANLPYGSGYYHSKEGGYEGGWIDENTYQIPLTIPKQVLEREDADMKFDFYVLVNAASVDFSGGKTSTRGDLMEGSFGDAYFGTSSPVISITDDGLPISGFFNKGNNPVTNEDNSVTPATASGVDLSPLKNKGYNFTAAELHEILPIVQLERAVSRIRFAFAIPAESTTNLEITKIELTGGIIPKTTYIFPRENGDFALPTTEYMEGTASITGLNGGALVTSSEITAKSSLADPKDLLPESTTVFSNVDHSKSYYNKAPGGNNDVSPAIVQMTSEEYSNLLDDYTASKYVYFRESDKVISGTIHYKINGTEQTPKSFSMTGLANTNFHRNHSWTVYAYFKGGDLRIMPVLDKEWVYNSSTQKYEYKQTGEAHIVFSDKSQSLFGYGYTTSTQNQWMNNWNRVTVTSIVTEYNASEDANQGNWSESAPTNFSDNKFFGTRSRVTFSNGRVLYTSPVAKSPFKDDDENVVSITGISVQYASGTNASIAPEAGWSNSAPSTVNNDVYVWSRTSTTYSDGSITTDDVCLYQLYKKTTEWYFRRQDWNSEGHEHDHVQPSGASPYAWNDWVHSQMVVAPGLNAANVPAYSNRIELVTSYFTTPLYLKLTNPTDFSIVLYHSESNSYEVFSDASGAEIPSNYYVEGGETKHRAIRSYFYVVPKDTATPGATTGVYLVTGTDTNNPNPMKLPFNSDAFPGSRDYTEVYFYCVDEATFWGYYTTQPVNIKAYDKSGEVTI